MSRKTNLDKFEAVMFDDRKDLNHLTPVEQDQVMRYRFAFARCLDNPAISDKLLRDELMNEFGIGSSQAYVDISNIKVILPNIRNAGKEWMRYLFNEEIRANIAKCKDDEGNITDVDKHRKALDVLAKYNKLDQKDTDQLPWDDIIPVQIEPTSDPTVLGITPLANKEEVIRKLYEKYKGDIEVEDIDYQEMNDRNEPGKETDLFQ